MVRETNVRRANGRVVIATADVVANRLLHADMALRDKDETSMEVMVFVTHTELRPQL